MIIIYYHHLLTLLSPLSTNLCTDEESVVVENGLESVEGMCFLFI
jgi:hypothetical protein